MQNVMIDIETMGTVPGSAIVSIGAYCLESGAEFYRIIDLGSNFRYKMTVDSDTISWWMTQSEEARAVFKSKDKVALDVALNDLAQWLPDPKGLQIWGNCCSFDCVLLGVAYRRVGQKLPWNVFNERSYRTAKAMYTEVKAPKFEGTKHNAIADAIHQGNHLRQILQYNKIQQR